MYKTRTVLVLYVLQGEGGGGKIGGMKNYDSGEVEAKWQKKWRQSRLYEVDLAKAKKPYYNLMMFPYPSAEGLHVGNMYAFTGADIYGRYQRMKGQDVFEPIGLDGFGIHSENYAIKIGKHPAEQARVSQRNFYRQLGEIGNGFAWEHRLETYDPAYYRWTQWLFVELYKAGLVYRSQARVNWCPSCKTVLADEQVEDGECERCKTLVERRQMNSWYFRITKYADRLLANIYGQEKKRKKTQMGAVGEGYEPRQDGLVWPERIKVAQKQWIGKKTGIDIEYEVEEVGERVVCFTTRPDTNYGATFIVLAPEHELVGKVVRGEVKLAKKVQSEVAAYVEKALKKSEQQRLADGKKKTGVFTGLHAVNRLNGYRMPVWVSDFVLAGFGTGAVVGVPGHDKRDFEFAGAFGLPVRKVVQIDTEMHSVVVKKSVGEGFLQAVRQAGWSGEEWDGWAYRVVVPVGDETKYIEIVQKYLLSGPWYAHMDGSRQAVVYKEKVFELPTQNQEAKVYGRKQGVSVEQLDWDDPDNYMFCTTQDGVVINSDRLNGLETREAVEKMIDYLEEKGWGKRNVSYHLRDWLISRQRYWGPPIPLLYCASCAAAGKSYLRQQGEVEVDWDDAGWWPVPEVDLPVELPLIEDYVPEGNGSSPLSNAPESWRVVKCPGCGGQASRELDVSDTFLDSSWYYLAYPNLKTKAWREGEVPFDKAVTQKWLPVSAYIGGAEHAVLHLLYSRFVVMALFDLGYLKFEEPFPFLYSHGLIIKDGAKMSKSRGNVVNPDDYIKRYGADVLRAYLMFIGPYDQGGDFRDTGMQGMQRFVNRLYQLLTTRYRLEGEAGERLLRKLNWAVKRVNEGYSKLRYNVVIAALMELYNEVKAASEGAEVVSEYEGVWAEFCQKTAKLMAPVLPHLAEELWQEIGREGSVHKQSMPEVEEKYLVAEMVSVVVQINGKKRGVLELAMSELPKDKPAAEKLLLEKMRGDEKLARYIEKGVKRMIYIPDKLINLVVS